MTTEKALAFAKTAAHYRRKFGKQTSPPYLMTQIMEVFELLDNDGRLEKEQVSRDDVIKLRRQLGAQKSRFARLLKRLHEAGVTDNSSADTDTDEAEAS